MFFSEQDKQDMSGGLYVDKPALAEFNSENIDINNSTFNAMFGRVYARWSLHFIITTIIFAFLSQYFSFFFLLIVIDYTINASFRQSETDFVTEDPFYDYRLYLSHLRGLDSRIDFTVYIIFDRCGEIPFGFNDINLLCENIFKYDLKESFGLENKFKSYNINKFKKNKKLKKKKYNKINNLLNIDNNISFSRKNIFFLKKKCKDINTLLFIYNKLKNNTFKVYYNLNTNRYLNWFKLNYIINGKN